MKKKNCQLKWLTKSSFIQNIVLRIEIQELKKTEPTQYVLVERFDRTRLFIQFNVFNFQTKLDITVSIDERLWLHLRSRYLPYM